MTAPSRRTVRRSSGRERESARGEIGCNAVPLHHWKGVGESTPPRGVPRKSFPNRLRFRRYAARMQPLLADECRALGTLIEKAMTTPGQYPLSLNGLVAGINQRSNRDPVVDVDEDRALRAVDGLRAKGLVRDVTFTGSRVEKFRHIAGECLNVRAPELALLTELLLRGPQSVGELRGRASRMHAFESLESVEHVLEALATREAPLSALVRELPPLAGSRAKRWMQLLCPSLHPIGSAVGGETRAPSSASPRANTEPSDAASAHDDSRIAALEARVAQLEHELRELKIALG